MALIEAQVAVPSVSVLRECRVCHGQKPPEDFFPSELLKKSPMCRSCWQEYGDRRKVMRQTYEKRYHRENPARKFAASLKRRYGMTLKEYNHLLEQQGELCAACRQPETRKTPSGGIARLHVDHDHSTGRVRGLLCTRCNFALGYAQEDPAVLRLIADYAEEQCS